MRYQGKITTWQDDKGFGFVTQNGGGHKAFVHISAFENRARRPAIGDIISYDLGADEKKRLRAERVKLVKVERQPPTFREDPNSKSLVLISTVLGLFALLLLAAVLLGRLPFLVPLFYLVMSLITLFAYGLDKSAAMNNRRRTSEDTLHVLALFCGWPGALFAQAAFRHKSRKREFQTAFWVMVVLNCGVLLWLMTDHGSGLWRGIR